MNRQRIALLAVFILVILAMSGLIIYRGVVLHQTTFMTGSPPLDLENYAAPQTVDLGQMRPPAVRLTDFSRYGGVTSSASIIVFGDYMCDECKRLDQAIAQVLPKYQGTVRYIWRDAPQANRNYDLDAAIFAYCAGLQNKFWPAHDLLLQASPQLDDFALNQITATLKLDPSQMSACRMDQQIRSTLQQDAGFASSDGVTSTPILFIGAEASKGYMAPETIDSKIKLYLNP